MRKRCTTIVVRVQYFRQVGGLQQRKRIPIRDSWFFEFYLESICSFVRNFSNKFLRISEILFIRICSVKLTPYYFFKDLFFLISFNRNSLVKLTPHPLISLVNILSFLSNFVWSNLSRKIDPWNQPWLALHLLCLNHPRLVFHVLYQNLRPEISYPLDNDLHLVQIPSRRLDIHFEVITVEPMTKF